MGGFFGRSMRNRTSPCGFGGRIASLGTFAPIYPVLCRVCVLIAHQRPGLTGWATPSATKFTKCSRLSCSKRLIFVSPLRMLGDVCRPCRVIIHSRSCLGYLAVNLSSRTVTVRLSYAAASAAACASHLLTRPNFDLPWFVGLKKRRLPTHSPRSKF